MGVGASEHGKKVMPDEASETKGPVPALGRWWQGGVTLGGRRRKMESRIPLCQCQRGPWEESSLCSASSLPLENGDHRSMYIREAAEVPL